MSQISDHPSYDQALEQAAEWAIELGENPSQSHLSQWQTWLNHSQINQQAWLKIQQVQTRFQSVQTSNAAKEVLTGTPQRQIQRREFLQRFAAFGGITLGASWLTSQTKVGSWVGNLSADAHTNIGQRQKLTTFAGALWLNTTSALNLSDTEQHLQYELLSGEIALNSMNNQRTSQYLSIDGVQIISQQAHYAARRFANGHFQLSLIEGEARITAGQQSITLQPRQAVTIKDFKVDSMATISPHAFSWTQGRLEVIDMPLSTLAAELNRYTLGHIHVDKAVQPISIVGAFPVDDINSATQLLSEVAPIKVSHPLPYLTLIQAV